MKTVIYLRVSSEQQSKFGFSLENQTDRAVAYCTYKGFENPVVLTESGISGKRMDNRPRFQELLRLIEEKEVDNIVCYSISRIGRDAADLLNFLKLLTKHDIDIYSTTEGIDGSTPFGRYMIGMIALNAQLEVELISERTSSILQNKKSKGETYCRQISGFDNKDGQLVKNDQYPVVQKIIELHKEGHGYTSIAKQLNDVGVKSANGNIFYASSIKKIINNQIYTPIEGSPIQKFGGKTTLSALLS